MCFYVNYVCECCLTSKIVLPYYKCHCINILIHHPLSRYRGPDSFAHFAGEKKCVFCTITCSRGSNCYSNPARNVNFGLFELNLCKLFSLQLLDRKMILHH